MHDVDLLAVVGEARFVNRQEVARIVLVLTDEVVKDACFACVVKVKPEIRLDVESRVKVKRERHGFFDAVGLVGEHHLAESAVFELDCQVARIDIVGLLVADCKLGRDELSHAVLVQGIFVFADLFEESK